MFLSASGCGRKGRILGFQKRSDLVGSPTRGGGHPKVSPHPSVFPWANILGCFGESHWVRHLPRLFPRRALRCRPSNGASPVLDRLCSSWPSSSSHLIVLEIVRGRGQSALSAARRVTRSTAGGVSAGWAGSYRPPPEGDKWGTTERSPLRLGRWGWQSVGGVGWKLSSPLRMWLETRGNFGEGKGWRAVEDVGWSGNLEEVWRRGGGHGRGWLV